MSELKTDYAHIKFRVCTIDPGFEWTCFSRSGHVLGFVAYNREWREYEYCPNPGTAYTHQCHDDIADFLEQLNIKKKGIKNE